jgi:hypothetical protein
MATRIVNGPLLVESAFGSPPLPELQAVIARLATATATMPVNRVKDRALRMVHLFSSLSDDDQRRRLNG